MTTPTQTPPQGSFQATPNAEKYVLEADALRRRQLQSALLHGSGQTWRERRRVWPASIGGLVAIVITVAVVAITGAYHRQQEINERQQQQRQQSAQGANSGQPNQAGSQAGQGPYSPENICNKSANGTTGYQRKDAKTFQGGAIYLLFSQRSGLYCVTVVKAAAANQPTEAWYKIERANAGVWTPERTSRPNVLHFTRTFLRPVPQCRRFSGGTGGGSASIVWGNCG